MALDPRLCPEGARIWRAPPGDGGSACCLTWCSTIPARATNRPDAGACAVPRQCALLPPLAGRFARQRRGPRNIPACDEKIVADLVLDSLRRCAPASPVSADLTTLDAAPRDLIRSAVAEGHRRRSARRELIAEPWDNSGGHQVGRLGAMEGMERLLLATTCDVLARERS